VSGDLRIAGADFARIQKGHRSGRRAKLDCVQENETVKSPIRESADVVFGGGGCDNYVRDSGAQQILGQPYANAIVAAIHIPQAHQANPALEQFFELLAEVFHQMSSPSFLICS
jgi:hypothetical protein